MFSYLAVFNSFSPHTLLVSYYLLCSFFSESVSLSQASNSPIVGFPSRRHLALRSLFRHLSCVTSLSLFRCQLSCPTWACPVNLTEGHGRCRKRQQTEDETCIKLGPGWLGLRWRHTSPVHLQWVYYIQWQKEVERQLSGERKWHCNPQEQEEPVTTSLWT
jgi:hypothetical protein